MNDLPRQQLHKIVDQYGQSVVDNPRRCKALLYDYCGGYRREIFVLSTAQEENVPKTLQDGSNHIPLPVLAAQLTQRLVENRALDEVAARWAVESWAYALGIALPEAAPRPGDMAEPQIGLLSEPLSPLAPVSNGVAASSDLLTFASTYKVEVFGRPRSTPDAKWKHLGVTPGSLSIPANYVLGLRPSGLSGALSNWVKEIGSLDAIISLELSDKVTDVDLSSLQNFTGLTYLEISQGEQLTDAGLAHLRSLPQLLTLNLSWCTRMSDHGLLNLQLLTRLSHLSIAWANIGDAAIAHLRHLVGLTTLALRECKKITGRNLAQLKPLAMLSALDFYACSHLSNVGLRELSVLTGVRKLDLSRCAEITKQGIVYLRVLTNLSYLDLSWNAQVGDAEVLSLCDLPVLSSLNLSRTKVTDRGMSHLGDMANLIYLDLSWCEQLTDTGLSNLARLSRLAYLNLTGCRHITKRGINRIQRPGLYVLH